MWLGWTLTSWILGIGALITLYSLRRNPAKILRWQGAVKLDPYYHADLYQMVKNLAHRAELSRVPDVYLMKSRSANAFAVGSEENPVVGVSQGLLQALDYREIEGVLAHEISHIKNNDLYVKGLAASFGNLTHTLSWIGKILLFLSVPLFLLGMNPIPLWPLLLLALSPTLNLLLQLGLSRSMEYLADLDAAVLTGDPMGLASALQRIERMSRPWWWGQWQPMASQSADWLRSHPNTRTRIERLAEMQGQKPVSDRAQPTTRWRQPHVVVTRRPIVWEL
ncbi:MAG TPA: hypothetical protein DCR93_39070 [Cytophagales bacterium]|nr:hypothetical protein [Cytophagales bacterium]